MKKQKVYKACDCKDFRFGGQRFENYITDPTSNSLCVKEFDRYALLHVLHYNEKYKQLFLKELVQTENPYDDYISCNVGPVAVVWEDPCWCFKCKLRTLAMQ